jgi:hypothetical protein
MYSWSAFDHSGQLWIIQLHGYLWVIQLFGSSFFSQLALGHSDVLH